MISQETKNTILSTANITDVIGDFVKLQKKGANYLGLCPFHDEKTPSFVVNPSSQKFKCFGCGKSGNVISFLMDQEKYSFVESLQYLGKKYNIEINPDLSPEEKHFEDNVTAIKLLLQDAGKYFTDQLPQSKALQFLKEREISAKSISEFGIGYCPDTFKSFSEQAIKSGWNKSVLINAYLMSEEKENDLYRGRVIYPITHPFYNHIIGFAGRTLKTKAEIEEYYQKSGNKISKFINPKDTVLYKKSNVLYNFYRAKKSMAKRDEALIVEGYHDVISYVEKGFENTVAPCGTVLTADQLRLIRRFTNNLNFLFDGDAAGIKAAVKSIDTALPMGFEVTITLLPAEEDPDSFARKHTPEEILQYHKENCFNSIQFLYNTFFKKDDLPAKRTENIKLITDLIAKLPDAVIREEYTKLLCKIADLKEEIINTEVKKKHVPVENPLIKPGALFGFKEAANAIKTENCCNITSDNAEVIEQHLKGNENFVGYTDTIDKSVLKELRRITKDVIFSDRIDEQEYTIFKNKFYDEIDFIVMCKLMISKGFNITITTKTINHDYPKNTIDLNTLCENSDSCKEYKTNFIDFYIQQLIGKIQVSNRHTKTIALERSAEIVSFLSETDRITSIDLIKNFFKAKNISFSKSEFQKILQTYLKKNKSTTDHKQVTINIDNPDGLTEDQLKCRNDYTLYFKDDQIFFTTKDEGLKSFSNFTIEPILHTISVNNVQKIFQLHNIYGDTKMISMNTECLNSEVKFCSRLEEKGNFRFDGGKFELKRLKRYLMDQTVYSQEIEDLGWHRDGFWAWANGVSTTNGEFIDIDDYGRVSVNKRSYFLKPFSELYRDDKTVFVNERNFRYIETKSNINEFTKKYVEVFGDKAKLCICAYLTTLFSDFIFARKGKLPLINLFGPKGTGKTEQATSLQYLFGEKPDILNISSATPYASAYLMKIFVNAICVIDEYKNSIGIDKIEFIKSLYNRHGRVRGSVKEGVNVEKIPVNSMVFLCGQQMPTADVALLSRCIFISNYKDQHSQDEKDMFNKFQDYCKEGHSNITNDIIQYRSLIENEWQDAFIQTEKDLKNMLTESDSRLIENNAIILATFRVLEKAINVDFTYEEMLHLSVASITEQMNILQSSNELAGFWSTLVYMQDRGLIKDGDHFIIKHPVEEDLLTEVEGSTIEQHYTWTPYKTVLYIKWDGLYQLFAEQAVKIRQAEILPENSLKYYMKHSLAFIGTKKSMRFGTKVTTAMAFDYDKLHIEMITDDNKKPDYKNDLPF